MILQGRAAPIRRFSTKAGGGWLLAHARSFRPQVRCLSSLPPRLLQDRRNIPNHEKMKHVRASSTWAFLPDALQSISIWGGSGFLLKTLNGFTGMPYWAAFAAISVGVRTALFPVVLYGAQTASRFAKIVPDVQFQLSLFQRDMKALREMKATMPQIMFLIRTNIATLSNTYRLYKINPLSVFLSPLLQIPIFIYISTDLRKILNGLDPLLAQQLVDTSLLWVPDLTEPDPWFGLPVLCGVLLYANVEVSLGRRSMAGGSMEKADSAVLIKDLFQSLAVFMPCFTSQLPAGMQIYVATSFVYTMAQSAALRNDSFRSIVGLPSMLTKPPEGIYSKKLLELKKLEQKAKEIRGDGPLLGKGVLMHGWEVSFPGTRRPSTIKVESTTTSDQNAAHHLVEPFVIRPFPDSIDKKYRLSNPKLTLETMAKMPYVHGVSAPPWQIERQQRDALAAMSEESKTTQRESLPQFTDEIIEKANRGEVPRELKFVDEPLTAPSSIKKVSAKTLRRGKRNKKRR